MVKHLTPTATSQQPHRWICPYLTWVVFSPAFFRVYYLNVGAEIETYQIRQPFSNLLLSNFRFTEITFLPNSDARFNLQQIILTIGTHQFVQFHLNNGCVCLGFLASLLEHGTIFVWCDVIPSSDIRGKWKHMSTCLNALRCCHG